MRKGTSTYSYVYNSDGIRTQKSLVTDGVYMTLTTHYVLDGTNVVAQYQTATNTMDLMNAMYFYYDEAGAPTGIKYNGNVYYFQKNLQGDIIRILNTQGSIVATYTYDAWGNIIASTDTSGVSIGTKNPFRYRGYYYDTETGLYYLNSRYYDPQVGRFISADDVSVMSIDQDNLIQYNLYAYCLNNPISYSDPKGEFALGTMLLKAAVGAVVNVATTYIGAKVTGQSYSWKDAGAAALAGALGTGGTVFKVAAGVVSGLYTGVTAYQNGADLGKAVLAGAVSAWGTTVSVANIAGWTGPALKLGVSTFTDVVFGIASNSIAAATYRASIETSTSNNTGQQVRARRPNNYKQASII